ncbi:hypothetical protein A2U01_0083632, partial [Trifolium medium]|nr:hypothetical protein [Trifolium medium]
MLTKFVGQSQTNFETMQGIVTNQGATMKNIEHQIGQLSKLMSNLSTNTHAGTTVDNPKEECKVLKATRQEEEEMLK